MKTAMLGGIATIANERVLATTEFMSDEKLNGSVEQDAFHLFLLMGQSNMAGYGELLPEDNKEIEGTYMLREESTEWKNMGGYRLNSPFIPVWKAIGSVWAARLPKRIGNCIPELQSD